jgi:tetratricopeptide (TPR) repeat protein
VATQDGHVMEPDSSGSDSVTPGTAQSGASDPESSIPGASERAEELVAGTAEGSAESGAVENGAVGNGAVGYGAVGNGAGESTVQDSDAGTVNGETTAADNGAVEPGVTGSEEPTTDLISDRLLEARGLTQAGELVQANLIYTAVLSELGTVLNLDSADSAAEAPLEGAVHVQTVDCLWNLANNLYVLNEVEESIPLFKKLVAIQELKLDPESDEFITPLLRLAIALKRAGDASESESTFERSMNLAKRVNPEGNIVATDSRKDAEGSARSTPFVHPLQESTQAHSAEPVETAETTAPAAEDPEAEVLKYLFSDNAPAHVVKKMSEVKPEKPSVGRSNVLNRSAPPIDYEKGFIDRNPAATRLSELDLASLGAIPSPDAMKTMFRDATFSDPEVRNTRSTAFLKANESADEPVKFGASTKGFNKDSAPFMVRNKWLLPTVAAIAAIFAIVFIGKSVFDKTAGSSHSPSQLGIVGQPEKSYASFDKLTVLQLFKDSVANYTANDKSHRTSCYFLDGDPRDFFRVIPGSYSGSDLWMQQNQDGLKQQDGVTLYSSTAPLNTVAKEMTAIAQAMQAYYGVNRSYPTTVEQFQAALGQSVYVNPYTHKGDPPKFFMTYSSTIGSSAKKLEAKTEAGENWINETGITPGEVHCCSLVYEDPAGHQPADMVVTGASGTSGNGTDFFIRGGDADSHFIAGSKPDTSFYIELNQGKSTGLSTIINGPSKPLDLAKMRILVAKDFSEQMLFLFVSGAIPAILLMGIGGGWLIQHQLYEEKDQLSQTRKKFMTQVLVICSVLLAVWIAVCALG